MSELVVVRRMLAAVFLVGSIGTAAELVLLEHTEGVWQQMPLALIAIGSLAFCGLQLRPHPPVTRAFRLVMGLFVASGLLGIVLHYRGNVEFELELQPEAAGWELFVAALAGATPSLAPGTMALLGAVGWTYAYRHPVVSVRSYSASSREELT